MDGKYWPLVIILIILGLAIPSFAQHAIKGRVIDEAGDPLMYAQIVLLNPADSTMQYYDVADKNGHYRIINIKPGHYLMQYSYVGKEIIFDIIGMLFQGHETHITRKGETHCK